MRNDSQDVQLQLIFSLKNRVGGNYQGNMVFIDSEMSAVLSPSPPPTHTHTHNPLSEGQAREMPGHPLGDGAKRQLTFETYVFFYLFCQFTLYTVTTRTGTLGKRLSNHKGF